MPYPNPNVTSPTQFSSGVVIADVVSTSGGSQDSVFAGPTLVGGLPATSCLELSSTTGGLTLPRMTSVQKNSIVRPLPGQAVFDTTLNEVSWFINSAWQSSSSLNGSILATFTLNQAAVQAMYGTAQLLLPAVAGFSYYVNNCVLINNFNTAAFAGGGAVILQYGSTNHGGGTNALSTTFNVAVVTAGATSWASLVAPNAGTAITGTANTGLYLSNATGAFTGGNAASTLVCVVKYQLLPANA